MKILISINIILALYITIGSNSTYKPKQLAEHVVKLKSDSEPLATGFYLVYRGTTYLITNHHVCDNRLGVDTKEGYHPILAMSKKTDLCLLQSFRSDGLRLAFQDADILDKVHVLGYPLGYDITSRSGRIVKDYYTDFPWISSGDIRVFHVSVAIFGGNSGSPLLNDYGRVIGVVFAANRNTGEDGYVVPKEDLIEFIEQQRE